MYPTLAGGQGRSVGFASLPPALRIDRSDRIRFHAAHLLIPTHRVATPFLLSINGTRLVVVMSCAASGCDRDITHERGVPTLLH